MANAFPLAPTPVGPPNNSYVVMSSPIVFTWQFNDVGDYQTVAYLYYTKPGDLTWSGPNPVATAGGSYAMPAGTLLAGMTYEWQISTVDSAGQEGPRSASQFFNTIPYVPAPTVTSPGPDAVITANPLPVAWTLPAGFTQDDYYLVVTDPSDLFNYYVSEFIHSSTQNSTVPLAAGSGLGAKVRVHFRYNGYWSSGGVVSITNAILPPEIPLVVHEQVEDKPEVVVRFTNPPPSDGSHLATVSVDILRDGVPIAKALPPNSSFVDAMVGAGTVVYVARATTSLGGTADSF